MELARWIVSAGGWVGRSPARWGLGGMMTRSEAVAELRGAVASLPYLDELHGASETTKLWSQRRRELRRLQLSRDPGAFLTWTPIVNSMTFGLVPWIRSELRALRGSGQWEERWRPALRENRAGLPMPSHVHPATSGTLIHHAYHLYRFELATGTSIADCNEIVEFGGGYGSMARLMARLGHRGPYCIHDLPEFSALQRFYLRSVCAETGTGELADALSRVTFSASREDAWLSRRHERRALFLATWSLGETPVALREEWRLTLGHFKSFLIGFNRRFEGIDNLTWFEDMAASRPDVDWRFEPVEHRNEAIYLFGIPM